jgi:23S rRNA (cytidine1920-2'-O)/16S rRNA (cytidine1409-2'-O)-methyltransferase
MLRLDQLLVERGHSRTPAEAAALVMAGRVLVDERLVDKAGTLVSPTCTIRLKASIPYVSRGGLKLKGGLDHFGIDPKGWICLDVGASTGGFTDCLLQAGAAQVYAVDVAYGLLDWKIRSDPRVVVLERCNARYLTPEQVPEPIDFCVIDVSFISLTRLLPVLRVFFGSKKIRIVCLVKPQFELERDQIGSGGVVREEALQIKAVEKIIGFSKELDLTSQGFVASTIKGSKGNQEYLLHLVDGRSTTFF